LREPKFREYKPCEQRAKEKTGDNVKSRRLGIEKIEIEVTDVQQNALEFNPCENDYLQNLSIWVEGIKEYFNCILFVISAADCNQGRKRRAIIDTMEMLCYALEE
jgi:hypothetical protein